MTESMKEKSKERIKVTNEDKLKKLTNEEKRHKQTN